MDKLTLHNITDLPEGQALEKPLHPYRKRKWQPPSVTATAPSPPTLPVKLEVDGSSVSSVAGEAARSSPRASSISPASSVPSPSSIKTEPRSQDEQVPLSRQRLRMQRYYDALHYGIKPSSGESDDDEVVCPLIPRSSVPSPSLTLYNITDLPKGEPLETPLHPYRKRKWQPPSVTATAPSPPTLPVKLEVDGSSVSSVAGEAARSSPRASSISPASSVPSPSSIKTEPRSQDEQVPLSRQRLRMQRYYDALHYGIKPSSGESDDDEGHLETQMDEEPEKPVDTPLPEPVEPSSRNQDLPSVIPDVPPTATNQPWSVNDFDWRAFPNPPIPPQLRRETFSDTNVGPTVPLVDPFDIFIAIWDRKFMEHVASETNRYVQQLETQLINSNNFHPNSRINQWRNTTADELYVYFGIILAMGVVVKSRIEEYWSSTPDIFYTPGFSEHMSMNRFNFLTRCLHFNNNENMCALNLEVSEARLFKIQPVLDHLNDKFQNLYNLHQNIALDESLLQRSLDINQLNPNKSATVGIKTYEICESQTGYLWRFEVHTCKKSSPQQSSSQDPLKASTPSIVLKLIHGLENRGHTLWMDSFYNSPCLARRLKVLGLDCVGTLRTNRLFVPEVLHNLTKNNMRPGQITGLTSGDVDVMVWRDSNRISMISTYHGNGVLSIQGSTKPILILDYINVMGGVDKKDEMLAMYPIERKQTKIWYKKLFMRLINVSVLNSYVIHKHNATSPLSHRDFRMCLINSLLSKYSSVSHFPPAITKPANRHLPPIG